MHLTPSLWSAIVRNVLYDAHFTQMQCILIFLVLICLGFLLTLRTALIPAHACNAC